jgi:zinc protease
MMLLYNPAFKGDEIVKQVEEEIATIQNSGVEAAELDRARTYLRSSRIRQIQSSHNRATLLGKYELIDGKPEYINTELNDFLAVTPAQIQAVAKKYIDPRRLTVLNIVPAPESAEKSGAGTNGKER